MGLSLKYYLTNHHEVYVNVYTHITYIYILIDLLLCILPAFIFVFLMCLRF